MVEVNVETIAVCRQLSNSKKLIRKALDDYCKQKCNRELDDSKKQLLSLSLAYHTSEGLGK